MRKLLLNLFFAMNSCSWIFFVFYAKTYPFSWRELFYLLGIGVSIVGTGFILSLFFRQKTIENLKSSKRVEINNDVFLPIYLGYFFAALSISCLHTLVIIYVLLVCFSCLSKTNYYNPTLFLLGYNYFVVTTNNNATIYILSKKEIKINEKCTFNELSRVSDYFFIDIEKRKK